MPGKDFGEPSLTVNVVCFQLPSLHHKQKKKKTIIFITQNLRAKHQFAERSRDLHFTLISFVDFNYYRCLIIIASIALIVVKRTKLHACLSLRALCLGRGYTESEIRTQKTARLRWVCRDLLLLYKTRT